MAEQQGAAFARVYRPRVDQALGFAAQCHARQQRKGSDVPYIVHPVHVAWLLDRHGFDDDVVIAGLLHDVVEDTGCSAEAIERLFGPRVARCVVAVSEPDKSLAWEVRKAQAVRRMQGMDKDAKAVSCADKAHNLHTIADALEAGNTEIWQRFNRGEQMQLAYFRQALAALSDGFNHRIVDELRAALDRVVDQSESSGVPHP